MKKVFFLIVGMALLFSSCSIHNGLTTNANLNTTEVVLSKKNFRVVESVQGQSEAMFVFGIGGLNKNAMVAEARAQMLANANIVGTSRAVVNERVEIKHSLFPFVRLYTVIVSGHVIEFVE